MHPKLRLRTLFVTLSVVAAQACAAGAGSPGPPPQAGAELTSVEVTPTTRSGSRALAGAPSPGRLVAPLGPTTATGAPGSPACDEAGVRIEATADVEPYLRRRAELFLEHCPDVSFTINPHEIVNGLGSLCSGPVDAAGLARPPTATETGACAEAGLSLVEIPIQTDAVHPGTMRSVDGGEPPPAHDGRQLYLFVAARSAAERQVVGAFIDFLQGGDVLELASTVD